MKLVSSLIFTVFVLLSISSCKKLNVDGEYQPTSSTYKSEQFLSQRKQPLDTIKFEIKESQERDTIIVFPDGNQIRFNLKESIKDLWGNRITGNIEFHYKAALTHDEIIFEDKQTVANYEPLVSAGAYYFKVKKDGQTLKLENYEISLKVESPQDLDTEMEVFLPSETPNGQFTWQNETVPPESMRFLFANDTVTNPDSTISSRNYWAYSPTLNDTLGWMNCDKFYNLNAPRTVYTLRFQQEDIQLLDDMAVYVVFKNFRGVMRAYRNGDQFELRSIPIGEPIYVAVVAFQGIDLYFASYSTTTRANHIDNVEMQEADEESVIQALKNLQ
ncbi:hypothetical protein [Luteibaculum oceani]|uniref:Uncharacterized protein n=1 Tax=Luteibaculum oceani TaxID=1294296 RepID=A0A5C6V0V6_9FLAO|nr:hypothetical protein [Luteibaculum oceani]TXC78809.1 hypothetical protein FRX97_06250 [Luteibaculum oceani]